MSPDFYFDNCGRLGIPQRRMPAPQNPRGGPLFVANLNLYLEADDLPRTLGILNI